MRAEQLRLRAPSRLLRWPSSAQSQFFCIKMNRIESNDGRQGTNRSVLLELLLRNNIFDFRIRIDDIVVRLQNVQRFVVLGIRRGIHVPPFNHVQHLQLQLHIPLCHHSNENADIVRRPNLKRVSASAHRFGAQLLTC